MTVLTLDLGTSATKAGLWADTQLISLAHVPIETRFPDPDRAEQDPHAWWRSVADAAAELRRAEPSAYADVDTIGCAAARETFACFDRDLRPLTPGILWSDHRAGAEATRLGDPTEFRRRTGVVLGAGCCAAKIAWVRDHQPEAFDGAAWILSPRDFIAARLTGAVRTERTLASRTGLYALDGEYLGDDTLDARLPPVVSSVERAPIEGDAALGLPATAELLLGAGDRACEALGVGASPTVPMVSWGTTANVSVPHAGPISELPHDGQVSVGPAGDFLVEAGLSAAGAALDWLGRLTGRSAAALAGEAATVEPGANGLVALPWLQGARAPWWRPDVHAALLGITGAHGAPHLARAIIEGVAFDVARCVERLAPDAEELALAGQGAADPTWRSVLAAVTGRPVVRRALDDGASAGARVLVAIARDEPVSVEKLNPARSRSQPDGALRDTYRVLRRRSDAAAAQALHLAPDR